MAYNYLKNVLKFRFPELRNQQTQREAEAAAREVGRSSFMLLHFAHTNLTLRETAKVWHLLLASDSALPAGALCGDKYGEIRPNKGHIHINFGGYREHTR